MRRPPRLLLAFLIMVLGSTLLVFNIIYWTGVYPGILSTLAAIGAVCALALVATLVWDLRRAK